MLSKKLFVILIAICFGSVIFAQPVMIHVVSRDTGDGLPYSCIRINRKGVVRTDSCGKTSIDISGVELTEASVSSFGYLPTIITLAPDKSDSIRVELAPSPSILTEAVVRPLKKDKDIIVGRQRLNLGFLNNAWLNIHSSYAADSMKGQIKHIYENDIGKEIIAPPGKLNRLKAFGMNVVPTDSMIDVLDFMLEIYDLTDHDPCDTISIPVPICEPIIIRFRSEEVNKKRKEFRYELPEPVDLPSHAVIIVSITWLLEDQSIEGKYIRVLTTKTGKYYKAGNPYNEFNPIYLGKKKSSPFFWEYTQYSLPEEDV